MAITLRQAEQRIVALEAAVNALQQAAGAVVNWRHPLIRIIGLPPDDTDSKSVSVSWRRRDPASAVGAVSVALDKQAAAPLAEGAVFTAAVLAGEHSLRCFIGAASTPEITYLWTVKD